jgi:hypothetical protein
LIWLGLATVVACACVPLGDAAPALADPTGPQYGTIGQYGEVWRGGGFDACWYDNGAYDGAGASHSVPGCTAAEAQPAPGKFIDPVGFTVNGSTIYVLDRTTDLPGALPDGVYASGWRLQELDGRGNVLGTTEFMLPTQGTAGVFNYEMLGLAVDHTEGTVDALVVAYCQTGTRHGCRIPTVTSGSTEYVEEILAWSTTPTGGQLVRPDGMNADSLSSPATGFSAAGVLSTASQLSKGLPEAGGSPQVVQPEGLAVDSAGGEEYLAVEGADVVGASAGRAAGASITQVCAMTNSSCAACPKALRPGVTCYTRTNTPGQGDIRLRWSANTLAGLPNDSSDEFFPPAGISTVPSGDPNAQAGSLTVLLDEGSGAEQASNLDVVSVPADLTDTPEILASGATAVAPGSEDDDAATATSDLSPENVSGDPDGAPTAATDLAAPEIISLDNGLYAGEFEPDPLPPQADLQNPDVLPGIWTADNPAVRLLSPLPDGTLSNDPAVTTNPPLTTLFDTLGNPNTNQSGSTNPASACNLSDAVSAANGASPFPSLAAGTGGTVWILTRGLDSSGLGLEAGSPGPLLEGGRYLIELAPQEGDPCPAPSGTFTIAAPGGSPQSASTSSPRAVTAGTPVSFDACPPPTLTHPNCPVTGSTGVNNLGAASAEYVWNFGDGSTDKISTVPGDNLNFLWPSPTDTHQFLRPGTFTITLTMLDDFGTYVETGSVDVSIGVLPVASFTNSMAGMTVNVDASASSATPGRQIIDYQWNWGDGQIDDSPTPTDSHTYAEPGTYTVTLSVLDSDYARSPKQANAVVTAIAPPSPPSVSARALGGTGSRPRPRRPAVTALVRSRKIARGYLKMVLSCSTGQSLCRGTIVLKTMKSIPLHGKRGRRTRRVLGRVTFAIAGGRSKPVSIRLSRQALALLANSRVLWTTVTVLARNPQGMRYTHTFRLALLPSSPLWGRRPAR